MMKVLVLEPYYGGSHKRFLDGLQNHLPFDFVMLTLPARKWKWRMRLAAPYFADKIVSHHTDSGIEAIFCSAFVDVATLRSILPPPVSALPFFTYFHENQFAYPVRRQEERDIHFGLTNLTTVLASDRVAFNSGYNLQTFIQGVKQALKICQDMKLTWVLEKITARSVILYPGIDFTEIDRAADIDRMFRDMPVIVWNHRWEHDKNPRDFFRTMYELDRCGWNFKLIVLGQGFQRAPVIFSEARERLSHRLIHWGFVKSRDEYVRLLRQADIVVSTSRHEFYGISVIEAVRAGCLPLLPDRLSYPELFPASYLYEEGKLFDRLKSYLAELPVFEISAARDMTERFSWQSLKNSYEAWFSTSCCS